MFLSYDLMECKITLFIYIIFGQKLIDLIFHYNINAFDNIFMGVSLLTSEELDLITAKLIFIPEILPKNSNIFLATPTPEELDKMYRLLLWLGITSLVSIIYIYDHYIREEPRKEVNYRLRNDAVWSSPWERSERRLKQSLELEQELWRRAFGIFPDPEPDDEITPVYTGEYFPDPIYCSTLQEYEERYGSGIDYTKTAHLYEEYLKAEKQPRVRLLSPEPRWYHFFFKPHHPRDGDERLRKYRVMVAHESQFAPKMWMGLFQKNYPMPADEYNRRHSRTRADPMPYGFAKVSKKQTIPIEPYPLAEEPISLTQDCPPITKYILSDEEIKVLDEHIRDTLLRHKREKEEKEKKEKEEELMRNWIRKY